MAETDFGIPEAAKMDFEAWTDDVEKDALDAKEIKERAEHAITALHFALSINQKSKAEIVKLIDEMPDDLGIILFDHIEDSCDVFEGLKQICEAAHARIMVSAAAYVQNNEGNGND